MASIGTTVELIFKGIDNASGVIGGISTSVENLAQPFAGLANNILIVDTALTAVAAVIAGKAISASNQFGASMADLNRFLEAGEGSAKDYQATFESLSVQYGIGVNEIVASTSDWRAANFDIKTSLELSRIAMDYSVAGQVSAAAATETLKKVLSGMNITQDEATASATRFGDVINYVADASKSNFQQIADGMAILAPTIKTSGASFEQMSGVVSILSDSLQSGTEAGNAIKEIMGQMIQPSKQAREALAEFGVTTDANNITQGTFYDVLSKIATKWPQLTDAQKATYAAMLTSSAETPRFITLMDQWGIATARATDAVSQSTGSMASEVERALATTSKAFESFKQGLNLLFVGLGQSIDPGVGALIRSMTGIETALKDVFNQSDNPFTPLINAANAGLTDLSKTFNSIGQNLGAALKQVDFSGLLLAFDGLFGELGTLFQSFFGNIDLTSVDGLASALQKITDVGEILARTTQGIISAFEPMAAAAGRATEEFKNLDSASQLDFGKFLGDAKLIVDAGALIGGALIAIGQTGRDMAGTMDQAFGAVKIGINSLQVVYDQVAIKFLQLGILITEADLGLAKAFGDTEGIDKYSLKLDEQKRTLSEYTSALERNKAELQDGLNQWNQGAAAVERLTAQQNAFNAAAGKPIPVTSVDGVISKLAQFEEEMQKNKASQDHYFDFLKDIPSDSVERVRSQMDLLHGSTKEASDEVANLTKTIFEIPQDKLLVKGDFQFNDEPIKNLIKTYDKDGIPVFKAMDGAVIKATGSFAAHGDAAKTVAEKTDAATKKSDEFLVKMNEIASNERIKNIEFAVKLKSAEFEADAKRVQATFASIDSTVKSTGDLLGGLFGDLTKTQSSFDKLAIADQINKENERRQVALDLQKQLAEAEIQRINAQTRSLDRGDALITIQAAGLEPELEAFMWKILGKIRTRANAEFADYLLGVGIA